MLYAITYKNFRGVRHVMFDKDQALFFQGSELTNQRYIEVQDRLADLLDGSPKRVKTSMFKRTIERTDYPQEKIAFWRQCLQTLEIMPYFPNNSMLERKD